MLEVYPFPECLDPQRIKNPYTHEWITVPCGHCKQCILNKNNRLAFQCTLESLGYQYCLFITLTYANQYIPRLRIVRNEEYLSQDPYSKEYFFIDNKTNEILFSEILTDEQLKVLLSKVETQNDIPYLRKEDLQKWFKRLRKEISKFSTAKVRYYACGEYGPVHLRPHYHILLWFDDKEIFKVCNELIYKTWRYGRIDCQLSKGEASNYVASYVNSSCSLPSFYQNAAMRPFSVHSRFLGQRVLALSREKVYETPPLQFVNTGLPINGKYTSFRLWLSCYSTYYPKCKGFIIKSPYELYYSYTVYELAISRYPTARNTFELAKKIFEHLAYTQANRSELRQLPNEVDTRFYNFFAESVTNPDSLCQDFIDRQIRNIYRDLLISKHFIEFVCDGNKDYYYRSHMISKIVDFYKTLEAEKLVKFYNNQELYFFNDYSDSDDLLFFYDNADGDISTIKNNWLYKQYSSSCSANFCNRIKHKELNDKNRILFDDSKLFYPYSPSDLFNNQ